MSFITYEPVRASAAAFVDFWSALYFYGDEAYLENIRKPMTAERVGHLFRWKNGSRLSRPKQASLERNFIARLPELERLPRDTPPREFLDRFSLGGAIWRIFWLHCWQPDQFPIFDQHVHRAMVVLKQSDRRELDSHSDREKIATYLDQYLAFYGGIRVSGDRQLDRALWTFGKFIKTWRMPLAQELSG